MAPLLPGHGGAAAPDAAGRRREGLLPGVPSRAAAGPPTPPRAARSRRCPRRRRPRPGCRSTPTRTPTASPCPTGTETGDRTLAAAAELPPGRPSSSGSSARSRWPAPSAWCSAATRSTRRSGWSTTMLSLGRLLRRPGGAVPRRGADHRLHRRDHDPLPVRADAGRPRLRRTPSSRRCAGSGSPPPCSASASPGWSAPASPGRRETPSAGLADAQRERRQHPGDRRAAVHRLPARLRGHQRPADHRRGRRDGAGAHRARARQRRTQKELSRARFLTDRPQTLPGPGVFARANSVAAPALLPDGRVAEDSSRHRHRAAGARPDAAAHGPRAARLAGRRARHPRPGTPERHGGRPDDA